MSEKELQKAVIDLAHRLGWKVAHFTRAKTETGWRTPATADGKGFPDLVLVRENDRVIFGELKRDGGVQTYEQSMWHMWIGNAGGEFHVWRPKDWRDGTVEAALR